MIYGNEHAQQAHGNPDADDGERRAAAVAPAVLDDQREVSEHTGLPILS
jgi:hypothetical protein